MDVSKHNFSFLFSVHVFTFLREMNEGPVSYVALITDDVHKSSLWQMSHITFFSDLFQHGNFIFADRGNLQISKH